MIAEYYLQHYLILPAKNSTMKSKFKIAGGKIKKNFIGSYRPHSRFLY